MMQNLISFSGIFIIGFLAWIFSRNRKNINWHLIVWGIVFQLVFAFILFKVPLGIAFFSWLNSAVVKLLSFSKSGIHFLFGVLGVSPGEVGPQGEQSLGFILVIQALPTIIFFSALISLLYYLKVMQFIVGIFSRIFTKLLRISGAESLCASSNIFVGIESAFTVRPYLEKMTASELHTILTVGMATVASSVLSLYVMVLRNDFPMIAGHLISASVLSAVAAVIISKLVYPEDDKPLTLGRLVEGQYKSASSWIESIINGANEGVKLCVGIAALLVAFLGILALFNWLIGFVANPIVRALGFNFEVTLQGILGYIFYPLTLIIGVVPSDAMIVSELLGERLVLTEVFAYQHLSTLISEGALSSGRSAVLATYALCGFTHIASLAIFVGGVSALIPQRTKDVARLGFRALFSATLACLMTAAVAGVFYTEGATVLFQSSKMKKPVRLLENLIPSSKKSHDEPAGRGIFLK
ncbi:NupC/NupG family nucleoside CNT transporter [Thermoproteota archaeon]